MICKLLPTLRQSYGVLECKASDELADWINREFGASLIDPAIDMLERLHSVQRIDPSCKRNRFEWLLNMVINGKSCARRYHDLNETQVLRIARMLEIEESFIWDNHHFIRDIIQHSPAQVVAPLLERLAQEGKIYAHSLTDDGREWKKTITLCKNAPQ